MLMNNNIKCAVFDLDGTLVNTIDDLKIACDTVLKEYGRDYNWSVDDYKRFVGNGLKKLVERAFNHTLSEEELNTAFRKTSEIYSKIKLEHACVYEGMKEQLENLKERDINLAVVTNKPDKAAKEMVYHLFGENTFDLITGAVDGVPHKPAPDSTLNTLNFFSCTPDEAIYIGDSNVDMQTANNANVKAIGVLWGFRSREELEKENPYIIISNPEEITKITDELNF